MTRRDKLKIEKVELEAELLRKQSIKDKVSKTRNFYREAGLAPLQLWLPSESFQRFKALAVHERVTCNSPLPTDLADLASFEPDMFASNLPLESPELTKIKAVIAEFSAKAHPSSPRWAEARKLLAALEAALEEVL